MKKCPFCAEEIQADAIKCRFCGEFLKKKSKWRNCLIGCLLTFLVSIVSIIVLFVLSFMLLKLIIYKMFFSAPHTGSSGYPPFTGQGLEGIMKEFGNIFGALRERIMDALRPGSQVSSY